MPVIITTIIGLIGGWLDNWLNRQKLKAEIEVAKANAEIAHHQKLAEADIDWDRIAAQQMDKSWKDEWFAILLSAPAILAFLGSWGAEVATEGFTALDTMPDWYKAAFLTAIAASFGARQLVTWAKSR